MYVIRRDRTAEKRAELGRRLIAACIAIVGLRDSNLKFGVHAAHRRRGLHTFYGMLATTGPLMSLTNWALKDIFRKYISTSFDEEQQDDKAAAPRIATSKQEDGTSI